MTRHIEIIITMFMLSVFIFPGMAYAGGFDDVPADHWAYKAVQYLRSRGILEGDEWGKFNGDDTLTRYEFAVAIAKIGNIIDEIEGGEDGDIDDELDELTADIYAIYEELEKEFDAEIQEIHEILDEHGERIETLESEVDEVKDDVEALFNQVGNISFSADLRLRFEGTYKSDDSQVQRPRFRFRLAMKAPVNDEFTLKGRLASGGEIPTTTNQTIEDEFDKKDIRIDRVYLEWKPTGLHGWRFLGGKFPPNWRNTPATIDSDVNVEGIGQSYRGDDGLVLNIAELVPDEKGFYIVAQVGKEDLFVENLDIFAGFHFINDEAWKFIELGLEEGKLTNHMKLEQIDMDNYAAVDFIGRYLFDAGKTPATLLGNYILNLADDATDELSGLQQAAWARLKVGNAKELGDMEGFVEFGRIQANSVLSFLTDADRGSGDQEFWVGSLKFKWMENLDIVVTYYHIERLTTHADLDKIQFDLIGKV